MLKSQSIKSNFLFQIFYQIIVLVIPLIVSPILTRRLGDTMLGIYTYVNSIAYYFVVFANMGIAKHAQRIISSNRTNENELRKTVWSLLTVHTFFSIASLLMYIFSCLLFFSDNKIIFFINIIYVASALFDITWVFYGLENFKNVVIKNLIVRCLSFGAIVFFVKKQDDLEIYTLIETLSFFLGNIALFPSVIRIIRPIKFSLKDCFVHLKPMLVLSISVIASTLYTVFDKTLIGLMTTKENVAYYEYANKIINIPKTIVCVVGTVLFPRACSYTFSGNLKERDRIAMLAYYAIFFLSFASIFGLVFIGPKFALIYYGESFARCGNLIQCLSPLILIISFGEIIRNIFLIPMKKDVVYVSCICANAVINLILSVALIRTISVYGAVVGTISAELFGLIFQVVYCRKEIKFRKILKPFFGFFVSGIIMYFSLSLFDSVVEDNLMGLIILILFGAIIYIAFSTFYIAIFCREILRKRA